MPRSSRVQYQPSALGTKQRKPEDQHEPVSNKRHKNSAEGWADALLQIVDNPSDPSVVYCDEDVIAIKDKYPKAKHHFLVMPRQRHERYQSVRDLTTDDVPLLKHMERVANKLVHDNNKVEDEENNDNGSRSEYRYGFHAVPSMKHLHMHVISQDFDSPCLKHKKHWNSFTTTFFVPLEEVFIAVEKGDTDFQYRENRLKEGLKCHKCGRAQANMPKLKEHIRLCDTACGGKKLLDS